MNAEYILTTAVPKLALNRIEAAQAIGCSPATIDRLTIRGLLRPCRATYRPLYLVKELERFLRDNSAAIAAHQHFVFDDHRQRAHWFEHAADLRGSRDVAVLSNLRAASDQGVRIDHGAVVHICA